MSQSHVLNYMHITFSTKNREHLIQVSHENDLHAYLGGVCNKLECLPIKIGGYTDHIHILCLLSKKIALMKFIEQLKSHSSKWMKLRDKSLKNFYWQDGYGAFSINPTEVDTVMKYISNQHEHHKNISFQDEFRAFLKKYKVEFNEKYIWG
ncbi:MAG TPA: IS200/IS605 family transposase [Saprospiraceae bacterium]|nr:IS200/IS605 family transposase [Saprospiraceae bacterium]